MDVILGLLEFLKPDFIYVKLGDVVAVYTKYVVPFFIVMSIVARKVELAVENLGNGAQWAEAIKDVKIAVIFTALYSGFGVVVMQLHGAFCNLMYDYGSIKTIVGSYKQLLKAARAVAEDGSFSQKVVGWTNFFSHQSINWMLFYFSFVVLILVQVLLQIIYALAFCLLYLWGMAAIPTMASKVLRITHGWFRSVITLLLWPIIEATLFIFVDALFKGWGAVLMPQNAMTSEISKSGMYLLFAFCNVVLIAVMIAALVISIKIAQNQNMVSGLAAPVLAAGAAGVNIAKTLALKTAAPLNPFSQPTAGSMIGRVKAAVSGINERALPSMWSNLKKGVGGLVSSATEDAEVCTPALEGQTSQGPKGIVNCLDKSGPSAPVTPANKGPGKRS
ncbi:MAG: hypothetical protein GY874_12955 [Desulfobacteraceae bacterium]|nr:hypothetical protein [Desulfobacteraceae bacterium]